MKKQFAVILILLIALPWSPMAQVRTVGTPFILNYSNKDYDAAHQNWDIVQDNRGVMYFGNTESILEYDGKNWRKISVSNKTAVLALAKDKNGKIFVGAKSGELGCLEVDSLGRVNYVSLSHLIPKEKRKFNKIRKILVTQGNKIIFISALAIYIYDDKKFTVFDVKTNKNRFVSGMEYKNHIYIQEKGYGIWKYSNNKLVKFEVGKDFRGKWLLGMFPAEKGQVNLATNRGTFRLEKNKLIALNKSSYFHEIYKYGKYDQQLYMAGLYSKGAILFDKNMEIKQLVNQKSGLQGNGVYSIFSDTDSTIWLGLANGISLLFQNSPYSYLSENVGLTETVTSATLLNGKMYVGTRNGVYYHKWKSGIFEEKKFNFIEATQSSQVWVIDTVKGHLLCGSTKGLFEIKDTANIEMLNNFSITSFLRPRNYPNILIGGGSNGMAIFEYLDNKWVFQNKIAGVDINCRHIKEDNDGTFWVSNRNKGLYHFTIDDSLKTALSEKFYNDKNGLPSNIGNYVFYIQNRILIGTIKGTFIYDKALDRFVLDDNFNKQFEDLKYFNKIDEDQYGNIWYKEQYTDRKNKNKLQWEMGLLQKNDTGYTKITLPFLKMKNNIHSLKMISPTELIIGAEKGIVHYNLNFKKNFTKKYATLIRKVSLIDNDSLLFGGAYPDANKNTSTKQPENFTLSIPFKHNGIAFSFAALFYEEPEKTLYKFYLEGNEDTWSDWKVDNFKEYSNLSPGTYTFHVKAKNLYGVESQSASYQFIILPPLYRTLLAYILYALILGLIIWGIVKLSVRRVIKQKEILELIVEKRTAEIQEQNKELSVRQKEIEAKNNMLSEKNNEILQKNKDITSSINYAKRIQEAMLPMYDTINKALPESFILFMPRDIVSGDFYWFSETEDRIIITAVDCTGHGVPGAFMSMIGSEILTTIANKKIVEADQILDNMNKDVRKALKQDETENQDGMDMALCVIHKKDNTVDYAGAKNPLVYIQDGKLTQIKASKQSIGGHQLGQPFEKYTIKCDVPTWFYIFSDGFQDQFGGPRQRKFMIKRMKKMLLENHQKPIHEQKIIMEKVISDWMKNTEQTDDIILIGFKVG